MKPSLAVFILAVAAQWFVPLFGVWQQEQVIAKGVVVKIRCGAPDPYDPLRGRFLSVRPEQRSVPAPPALSSARMVPVWATLVAGADGISQIDVLSLEPIAGPNVIRLRAYRTRWGDQTELAAVEWPFDRFYLNERLAPDADRLLATRLRSEKPPIAEIRLLDGRAVLTDVLLDGVSIREIVKQQAK